jgi:hypothetical protein
LRSSFGELVLRGLCPCRRNACRRGDACGDGSERYARAAVLLSTPKTV